jgi:hypothetical protein
MDEMATYFRRGEDAEAIAAAVVCADVGAGRLC